VATHEKEFSTFRPLNVLICTWNVDAARPDALSSGGADNIDFLSQCLGSVDRPDIICFGFQEMIDLNDRKLTASKSSTITRALSSDFLFKKPFFSVERRKTKLGPITYQKK
jgi:hypothetical protein